MKSTKQEGVLVSLLSPQKRLGKFRTPSLSIEKLKAKLHYEPKTGKWTKVKTGKIASRPGKKGNRVQILGRRYSSGKLIWFYMKKRWPKNQIDHKNRNKFDDRWINLREATHGQNNVNKAGWGKSGFKGVTQDPRNGRYRARLCIKGRYTHLGTFDTACKAAQVHDKKARELYGEFA